MKIDGRCKCGEKLDFEKDFTLEVNNEKGKESFYNLTKKIKCKCGFEGVLKSEISLYTKEESKNELREEK